MKAKHILSKPGEFTTVTKIENGMVTLSKNIEGSEHYKSFIDCMLLWSI